MRESFPWEADLRIAAAALGRSGLVRQLLEAKADVDAANPSGAPFPAEGRERLDEGFGVGDFGGVIYLQHWCISVKCTGATCCNMLGTGGVELQSLRMEGLFDNPQLGVGRANLPSADYAFEQAGERLARGLSQLIG